MIEEFKFNDSSRTFFCPIKTNQSSLVRLVTACQLYCHNMIQAKQGFMQSYKDKKQDFTQEGAQHIEGIRGCIMESIKLSTKIKISAILFLVTFTFCLLSAMKQKYSPSSTPLIPAAGINKIIRTKTSFVSVVECRLLFSVP